MKTITSLENVKKDGTRSFHNQSLDAVSNGVVIPIPINILNSPKLSSINVIGFWVNKEVLTKSKHNFKYPIDYDNLINK